MTAPDHVTKPIRNTLRERGIHTIGFLIGAVSRKSPRF